MEKIDSNTITHPCPCPCPFSCPCPISIPFPHVVTLQFVQIPLLVRLRPGEPRVLLVRSQLGIHGRRELGELPEGHAGILQAEGVSHGVLVQQVGRHVALGGVRVSRGDFAGAHDDDGAMAAVLGGE